MLLWILAPLAALANWVAIASFHADSHPQLPLFRKAATFAAIGMSSAFLTYVVLSGGGTVTYGGETMSRWLTTLIVTALAVGAGTYMSLGLNRFASPRDATVGAVENAVFAYPLLYLLLPVLITVVSWSAKAALLVFGGS